MNTSRAPNNSKIWLQWMLVNTVCWASGAIVLLLFFHISGVLGIIPGLVLLGTIAGVGQVVVLHGRPVKTRRWVVATLLGTMIGTTVAMVVFWLSWTAFRNGVTGFKAWASRDVWGQAILAVGAATGVAFGIIVALTQMAIVRWPIKASAWWVLGSAVGAVLDGAIIGNLCVWIFEPAWDFVLLLAHPTHPLDQVVLIGLVGALWGPMKGICTGVVLAWWLRKHLSQAEQPQLRAGTEEGHRFA